MSLSSVNSLGEIRRRHPSRNPYQDVQDRFSWGDRFAAYVSNNVGTTFFFWILALLTLGWVLLNYFWPKETQLDPLPEFAWWSLICNIIQLLLLPLLLAGQNVQSRQAEARAEYDLEIDQRAEKEVDLVLQHLSYQNSMLKALLEKQGIGIEKHGSINS